MNLKMNETPKYSDVHETHATTTEVSRNLQTVIGMLNPETKSIVYSLAQRLADDQAKSGNELPSISDGLTFVLPYDAWTGPLIFQFSESELLVLSIEPDLDDAQIFALSPNGMKSLCEIQDRGAIQNLLEAAMDAVNRLKPSEAERLADMYRSLMNDAAIWEIPSLARPRQSKGKPHVYGPSDFLCTASEFVAELLQNFSSAFHFNSTPKAILCIARADLRKASFYAVMENENPRPVLLYRAETALEADTLQHAMISRLNDLPIKMEMDMQARYDKLLDAARDDTIDYYNSISTPNSSANRFPHSCIDPS